MTDADEIYKMPDFVALYRESEISPRNAAVLWTLGQLRADDAYDDVAEHSDVAVSDGDDTWALFDELPRLTWRQSSDWRRQMARSFDDLTDDVASGVIGHPRTPSEEMALYLMLRGCKAAVDDDWGSLVASLAGLPSRADDYDWEVVRDQLVYDIDIEELYDPSRDGIEDPSDEENDWLRMGDYRPAAWFTTFGGREARDPRRGFRR